MEIKEFIKLEDEIKQILIDNPKTRNDDMYLYWFYIRNKNITDSVFSILFYSKEARKKCNVSPYETVSRCRRKIQAQCPELASERAIRKMKKELESDFKEYARM